MASFIHPQSCECSSSQLDLFNVPLTQTAIEASTYTEYHPISSISDGCPIEFSIGGSGLDYLDPQSIQLVVRAQITNADGTVIADDAQVAPVNLFLHSLFSQVDIKLNERLISSANNTYAYRSYLETLLSYGSDSKKSQLTAAMYYKDAATFFEERNPHADDVHNDGMKKRYQHFAEGRIVELAGRIHSDIFFQDKFIPSEVNMRIRLIRNRDNFSLMAQDVNAGFKVKIHDCKLLVRKVKLSSSVYLAHAKALEIGTAKFPIKRVVCKTFTIPRGQLDFTHEGIFTGQTPTRIVLCMLDNTSYNGS